MDRTVTRNELSQAAEAALAEVEANLSELRTAGKEPEIIADLERIVEETRHTLRSNS